jgi:hypothetical protein
MHREGRGRIGGEELTSVNDEQPWHDGWGTDEDKPSMNGGHGEAGSVTGRAVQRASADVPARGLGRRGARGWASGGSFYFGATWAGGRGRSGAPVGPTSRATAWVASCAPGRNVGVVGKMRRAAPHPMTGGPRGWAAAAGEERARALLEGGGRARLLGRGWRARVWEVGRALQGGPARSWATAGGLGRGGLRARDGPGRGAGPSRPQGEGGFWAARLREALLPFVFLSFSFPIRI